MGAIPQLRPATCPLGIGGDIGFQLNGIMEAGTAKEKLGLCTSTLGCMHGVGMSSDSVGDMTRYIP